ncbi:OmpW family protein [Myroides marinus]|uniref:OmpW family protein n=1 Tax=Myroides marinus TaxID=703342 RepID=A0A165QTD8_9FLAO|nr:OmpW family outer membrane protein [Myroides marinus]KZE76502.1 OmpW family protein [Myroides marinus]MDM1345745.1 OmpW family protein [Myroides marinus]MDM1349394.1 OmpW family protein [Myroides marinus]MDM1352928.1 OmpW family protein [Myroides marinus]MDM1356604.1 OmpW family protein [Myroides marinus]
MKKLLLSILGAALFVSGSSFAQETNSAPEKTDYKWQMRLRGVGVVPHNRADIGIIGGQIDVSNNFIPELDFTYFFTENLAAELILGTTRHTVGTLGSDLSAIGGPSSANVDLGSVYLLPPTLMFQYHHKFGEVFKPYVGLGVNYTIFYNEKSGVAQDIKYDNKFGWGYQFGFDIDLTEKFFINVDFKKLFLKTDVTVDATNLLPAGTPAGTTLPIPAKVKLDPMLIGFGVGMRF